MALPKGHIPQPLCDTALAAAVSERRRLALSIILVGGGDAENKEVVGLFWSTSSSFVVAGAGLWCCHDESTGYVPGYSTVL